MGSKIKFNLYDQHGFSNSKSLLNEKRNKQTKRLFKLLLIIISGLFVFTFLVKLPSIINVFAKPFPKVQNNLVNQNNINFNFRTNILLITHYSNQLLEISLGSLDPTDKKVHILSLDPNQNIYGEKKDTTLKELFALKVNDSTYLEKLTAKLIETLGFPIDGYILLDQKNSWQKKDQLERVADEVFSFGFFLNFFNIKSHLDSNLRTNLSVGDFNTLISRVKSLRPERFTILELRGGNDTQGYLQHNSLNKYFGLILTDSRIISEELTVTVVNASRVEGAGTIMKNMLNNIGLRVVEVRTGNVLEKSELVSKRKTSLDQRLSNMFKNGIKDRIDRKINVDTEVYIGNDIAKYFDF